MVATRWFKVDIGPSWELVDALVRQCSLRKVLPLPPWLSVSRTATPDLTWPGPITKMPTRAITWVLDDAEEEIMSIVAPSHQSSKEVLEQFARQSALLTVRGEP